MELNKLTAIQAPVLIIGLGGTGVDALLRIKKANENFGDQPHNMEYLAFDTDEACRYANYQGMKLDVMQELFIANLPNARPILEHVEQMPERIYSWLDTDIPISPMDLLSQSMVRQIGRLAFMLNRDALAKILRQKIKKVTTGYGQQVPLYVFVITGICGMTGGGTFLDIPDLVREVCKQESCGRIVNSIGAIVLPDVSAQRPGVSEHTKSLLYANGFAALKELDYLMDPKGTGARAKRAPYNSCILFSGKDQDGKMADSDENVYETTMDTVAETVFQFLFSEKDDEAYTYLNAWLGNDSVLQARHDSVQAALGGKSPVGYMYHIGSVSTACAPLSETFDKTIPLYQLEGIKTLYEEYKRYRFQRGLHLQVPTKVNGKVCDTDWRALPSPYPETEWVDFSDPVEKERNDKYREILEKAIRYGYVKEDIEKKELRLYYGTLVDYNAVADKYDIDLSSHEAILDIKVTDFTMEMERLLKDTSERDGIIEFVRTGMMLEEGTHHLKKDFEEMAFIRLFTIRDEIANMVQNHEAALAAIENVKRRETSDDEVKDYVRIRVARVIQKNPEKQGVYAIKDREGAVRELIAMDVKMHKMADFYLFDAFMALPQEEKDFLSAEAEKEFGQESRKEELAISSEQYMNMIARITEDLKWDHQDIPDGKRILGVYHSILRRAEQIVRE